MYNIYTENKTLKKKTYKAIEERVAIFSNEKNRQ